MPCGLLLCLFSVCFLCARVHPFSVNKDRSHVEVGSPRLLCLPRCGLVLTDYMDCGPCFQMRSRFEVQGSEEPPQVNLEELYSSCLEGSLHYQFLNKNSTRKTEAQKLEQRDGSFCLLPIFSLRNAPHFSCLLAVSGLALATLVPPATRYNVFRSRLQVIFQVGDLNKPTLGFYDQRC